MGYSLMTDSQTATTTSYTHVKRVAIMGAGVAGLQLAERLRASGKEVVIFEKTDKVGGVWSANYADFGLQASPPRAKPWTFAQTRRWTDPPLASLRRHRCLKSSTSFRHSPIPRTRNGTTSLRERKYRRTLKRSPSTSRSMR